MCTPPDTNPLPTIVIIHDAWHTPTHYSKLVDLLTAQGFEVACPQLLTCTTEASNTCSFNDDVNLLYPLVFDLASEGKNIICLMHGYGGYIGTEILGDLSASPRAQQGLAGGIVHMVWISSPLPDTGISMLAAMGGSFPDFMPLQAAQKDGSLLLLEPAQYLFNDLGAMETAHWCDHLVRFSARASDIVVSTETPAYMVCPSTYILCGNDQLISNNDQIYTIMLARKKGAQEISEELLEAAGHDPMISDPDSVAMIIGSVAEDFAEAALGVIDKGGNEDNGDDAARDQSNADDGGDTADTDTAQDGGNEAAEANQPSIAQTDGPADDEPTTAGGLEPTIVRSTTAPLTQELAFEFNGTPVTIPPPASPNPPPPEPVVTVPDAEPAAEPEPSIQELIQQEQASQAATEPTFAEPQQPELVQQAPVVVKESAPASRPAPAQSPVISAILGAASSVLEAAAAGLASPPAPPPVVVVENPSPAQPVTTASAAAEDPTTTEAQTAPAPQPAVVVETPVASVVVPTAPAAAVPAATSASQPQQAPAPTPTVTAPATPLTQIQPAQPTPAPVTVVVPDPAASDPTPTVVVAPAATPPTSPTAEAATQTTPEPTSATTDPTSEVPISVAVRDLVASDPTAGVVGVPTTSQPVTQPTQPTPAQVTVVVDPTSMPDTAATPTTVVVSAMMPAQPPVVNPTTLPTPPSTPPQDPTAIEVVELIEQQPIFEVLEPTADQSSPESVLISRVPSGPVTLPVLNPPMVLQVPAVPAKTPQVATPTEEEAADDGDNASTGQAASTQSYRVVQPAGDTCPYGSDGSSAVNCACAQAASIEATSLSASNQSPPRTTLGDILETFAATVTAIDAGINDTCDSGRTPSAVAKFPGDCTATMC